MAGTLFRFADLDTRDPGRLGGFRCVARLGEGGMGQVLLAFTPGGQPAAVKVIRSEFAADAQFTRRFADEVAAAQRVRGAHVAPLLDADPTAEQPWLATAYIAGPSLRELVAAQGPLAEDQVMLLGWGIAHALVDIHTAGVVHRDLKPGNIMLDESGPKVIDFGIVKSLAQSVTYRSQSTRIGTPLYMSPEQALGRAVGPACDIFALGSTLYFLATGTEAFAAENEWAVAHRIVADRPDLTPLTPPLRRLITQCLHKEPDQRPTPQRVRDWCKDELGEALRPGAWMRIAGARQVIQQRTTALHELQATRSDATATGGDGPAKDYEQRRKTSRGASQESSEKVVKKTTTEQPPHRTGLAADRGEVFNSAVKFFSAVAMVALASFLPIMREVWTDRSGAQVAQVTESFDFTHPWAPSFTGVPSASFDWAVVPVDVIGTAVMLCCVVMLQFPPGQGARLRAWKFAAAVVQPLSGIFLIMNVGNFCGALGLSTNVTNTAYDIRSWFLPGGWLLLLANVLLLRVPNRTLLKLRKRERRAGSPG